MNPRRAFFLLWVTLALSPGPTGAAEFYWFGSSSAIPNRKYNAVYGLSDNGQVAVGEADNSSGGVTYRWTKETGLVAIDDKFFAEDVSDDGSVIVGRIAFHDRTAIRWTEETGLQVIGPGTMDAVTPDGRIIAGSVIPPGATETQAVRWLPDGTYHTLGIPFGSRALGISNDGSVVAGRIEAPVKDLFRWTEPTGAMGLSHFALNCVSDPVLSANGSVMVGAAQLGFEGGFGVEVFRWTAETGLVALEGTTGWVRRLSRTMAPPSWARARRIPAQR